MIFGADYYFEKGVLKNNLVLRCGLSRFASPLYLKFDILSELQVVIDKTTEQWNMGHDPRTVAE